MSYVPIFVRYKLFVPAVLAGIAIAACVAAWPLTDPRSPSRSSVYSSGLFLGIGTGLLGALVTFGLIDVYFTNREKLRDARESEVNALLRQLRSPAADIVHRAADELRCRGELHHRCRGRYLSYANFAGVDLSGVDFAGARLFKVKFDDAVLNNACFDGSNVSPASLSGARSLRGAVMRDGSLYDGRLDLEGDLAAARADGIELSDAAGMSDFYGVSTARYNDGRSWTVAFLSTVREHRPIQHETQDWWSSQKERGGLDLGDGA